MKWTRLSAASLGAIGAFLAGFVVFNVGFLIYVERTYPGPNSMAGAAAFYYGIPVGVACAVIAFALILLRTRHW